MTHFSRPVIWLALYAAAVLYVIVAGVVLRVVRVARELIEVEKPI